jgi:hypothetical protein
LNLAGFEKDNNENFYLNKENNLENLKSLLFDLERIKKEEEKPIYFYSNFDSFDLLSRFAVTPFKIEGISFF